MKISEFLTGLTEELELEEELSIDTNLKELEEWDSMAAMIVIGYVSSNFQTTLTGEDISQIETTADLIEKIGKEKFDR